MCTIMFVCSYLYKLLQLPKMYMKNHLFSICLLLIGVGYLSAQELKKDFDSFKDNRAHQQKLHEEKVPSLKMLALPEATRAVHNELLKQPSLIKRLYTIDTLKRKMGIVFERTCAVRNHQQAPETIVDYYESNYISRLVKIGECPSTIEALSNDGKKAFYKYLNDQIVAVDTDNLKHAYTLIGHADQINCVEISPDNTKIATGSVDKTIRIWDASNGSLLYTFKAHTCSVTRLVFSNDSNVLISYGQIAKPIEHTCFFVHESNLQEQIAWDLILGKELEKTTDTSAIINCWGKYGYITKNYWFNKKKIQNFRIPGANHSSHELIDQHKTVHVQNGIVAEGKNLYRDQGFMAAIEDMPQQEQYIPLLALIPLFNTLANKKYSQVEKH